MESFLSNYKTSDLSTVTELDIQKLNRLKSQLDLILLALDSIAKIGSQSVDFLESWRFEQSKSAGNESLKQIDLETIKSNILIICHLARQYRDPIRRAVESLEQFYPNFRQSQVLSDYLDSFTSFYLQGDCPPERLALNLLVDLLFFSSNKGPLRLWQMLLVL